MSKHKFIVKVQLPLASSDGNAGVLVYNEDRSVMEELSIRSEIEADQLLEELKGEPKGFFYARMQGKTLMLVGVAPWQNW